MRAGTPRLRYDFQKISITKSLAEVRRNMIKALVFLRMHPERIHQVLIEYAAQSLFLSLLVQPDV